MQKRGKVFFGSAVALVTPFLNGEIDYESLGALIDYQINGETDAIVVLGTTGEAPTISEEERNQVIEFSSKRIKGRVPLIVGTGTNSTDSSVRYTKSAEECGANAVLCVTPYYNKPSALGMAMHYEKIAKNTSLPVILYNVPSRTGVSLNIETLSRLHEIPNVVGIKEASGNVSFVEEIISNFKNRFDIYTGNDDLTYATLSLGGQGVISVVANLFPFKMHNLCKGFSGGSVEKSHKTQLELLPFIREMFYETNPVPIKRALFEKGIIKSDEVRLPLQKSKRAKEIKSIIDGFFSKNEEGK